MSATSVVPARLFAALQRWPWLATPLTLARRFREDRLALTAGSLTFTTLISLVPLLTVMLALFSAFPMFATLEDSLQKYLLQSLVPDTIARPVLNAVNQFSNRASRLGGVGLVALVISALALTLTIDRALNAIWRVRKPRPIGQRVLVYWAAATLGPLVFAISAASISYAVSASRGYVGELPRNFAFMVGVVEFAIEGLAVAALFHYVPNTHVKWRHALMGGAFVALCLSGGKRALALYFGAVPTYALIYGTFATLPIFLVWIYLCWVFVLLGAVIAAYAPLVGTRFSRWQEAAGSDFHLALVMIGKLGEVRSAGARGLSAGDLAAAIGTDPLQIDALLDVLVALDWVGKLKEARSPRYVLLCDPATTRAEPLVARLLLDPAPDLEPLWKHAGFADLTLAQILAR